MMLRLEVFCAAARVLFWGVSITSGNLQVLETTTKSPRSTSTRKVVDEDGLRHASQDARRL